MEMMNNINSNAVQEQPVNYMAQYHKLKSADEEGKMFVNFFKTETDENTESAAKKVKKLTEQLEEAKAELEAEYGKIYANKYIPISKPNLFKYISRDNTDYYYNEDGVLITEDNLENYSVVRLDTKHGEVSVVVGYCYELASIIVKEYRYNISGDNSKCGFKQIAHFLIPFFEDQGVTNFGTTFGVRYSFCRVLQNYPAKEFINTLYGIDRDITYNLDAIREYQRRNPAFELILKTAPDSLLNKLIEMRDVDESKPVYKLLGLDKALYEQSLAEGTEAEVFELKDFIINKEVFHKTAPEWIEMMKDYKQRENDLDFFHITYATSWRYERYNNSKLLGILAESYSRNKLFQKYYTFGKYANYIVEETINQGFTHLEDFIDKLSDYLKMCNDQEIVPTLYSSYLTQTHDIAARNHKVFLDQEQEKIIAKRYEGFKPIKVGEEKEYQILAPTSSEDIKKEGDALNHCVASYIKRVLDGETKIFFMRKDPLQSLITLEVKDGKICQARGMHNRRPDPVELKAIQEFAKKKELKFNCAY